jgi:hypothetical protein
LEHGCASSLNTANHVNVEENMAFGLYVMRDGSVMVAYGQRHIPISGAQYKANGYKPPLEKLAVKSPAIQEGADCGHIPHSVSIVSAFAGSSCTR